MAWALERTGYGRRRPCPWRRGSIHGPVVWGLGMPLQPAWHGGRDRLPMIAAFTAAKR